MVNESMISKNIENFQSNLVQVNLPVVTPVDCLPITKMYILNIILKIAKGTTGGSVLHGVFKAKHGRNVDSDKSPACISYEARITSIIKAIEFRRPSIRRKHSQCSIFAFFW